MMKLRHTFKKTIGARRMGAANILIAMMLFVFLVSAAMTIDFAYMQLIKTELRTATDAAAKAGAEALARTQDPQAAITAAVDYAASNSVAGKPYLINRSDVLLGRVTRQPDGTYAFSEGQTPFNSVRVNSRIANDARTTPVKTFFGPAFGQDGFKTATRATASQQKVEVILCLDRSGSMLFDMSGTDYSYPRGNPRLSTFTSWGTTWQYHLSAPHPTQSRWGVLANAVDTFLTEAGKVIIPPRTALVTWASDYTMPITPFTVFPKVATDYDLPSEASFSWAVTKTSIQNAISLRTANPMMGSTNMSAGIDRAVAVLTGPNSQPMSNKVIILFTDGLWNEGRDPVLAARDAAALGITIHAVSMLTGSQTTLRDMTRITGGDYYATQNEADLQNAFMELARSLPVVLTD